MFCHIKVNSNTIELTVQPSCYCVLDLLCGRGIRLLLRSEFQPPLLLVKLTKANLPKSDEQILQHLGKFVLTGRFLAKPTDPGTGFEPQSLDDDSTGTIFDLLSWPWVTSTLCNLDCTYTQNVL